MHWVLQTNMFNEKEWDNLVDTLGRLEIPYSIHKVIPFIGELIPPVEPKHKKVICFGSYSMRHAAKKNNWNPGVYDLFDINFPIQLKHWGEKMLNHDCKVMPFKDCVLTEAHFIRPADDSKYFAGRVIEHEEWNVWRKSICDDHEDWGNGLTPETLIQVCKPKVIYAEYRFWVVNGSIVTYSQYKRGDRVIYSNEVDRDVISYANSVGRGPELSVHAPLPWLPKAFVLDVCETPDGFKIVEINTINSAGFYAGDVQKLIHALEISEYQK